MRKEYLPVCHFAAPHGWINDPNGLVWHDEIYELYYQMNPDGIDWNRMTWGHARSRDLLHWENIGIALEPDENGTMFSGCAIRNDQGLLGLPKTALIYFYTAAGHMSAASKNKAFSIRRAYSLDGGDTLVKFGDPVIQIPAWESRDPKLFWHEDSHAYIMVLWIDGNDFGIWRSKDLEHFEMTQRLTLEGGFECPDLFCLPVIGQDGEPEDSKYVFWCGDGSYFVGAFDGCRFTMEQKKKNAYLSGPHGILNYAAQTYSGISGGRVLSVAWLRTEAICGVTKGAMAIPRELTLQRSEEGCFLQLVFPEEIKSRLNDSEHMPENAECRFQGNLSERAVAVQMHMRNPEPIAKDSEVHGYHTEEREWSFAFLDEQGERMLTISCQKETKTLFWEHGIVTEICEPGVSFDDLEMIYDRGIVELSSADGAHYLVADFPDLRLKACSGVKLLQGDLDFKAGLL